jgi:hypothetical protein
LLLSASRRYGSFVIKCGQSREAVNGLCRQFPRLRMPVARIFTGFAAILWSQLARLRPKA